MVLFWRRRGRAEGTLVGMLGVRRRAVLWEVEMRGLRLRLRRRMMDGVAVVVVVGMMDGREDA
jgi:hypothetical protein